MKTFEVSVTRDGPWWMVRIPELDGLTQARRLSEVEEMAASYVAMTLDIPRGSFAVSVAVESVDGIEVASVLRTIRADKQEARRLEREAAEAAGLLAKQLNSHGVPLRDVGTILQISHQRAHQLVKRWRSTNVPEGGSRY